MVAEQPDKAPADEIWLIVDVGTNGEILLGNRERLFSASSPTGPAFEGAQIRHGMRAAAGAIERVRVNPETLEVRIKVIGREEWSEEWEQRIEADKRMDDAKRKTQSAIPLHGTRAVRNPQSRYAGYEQSPIPNPQFSILAAGICGSGIIEAVAELFTAGVLTPDGRFAQEIRSPRLSWQGAKAEFVLAWPHETSTGGPIVITSEDVRNIQLGKAALYSGTRLLMERMGVERVDRVLLAGAFGSYIDPYHAMVIGMIPDCDRAKIAAVGNSAGDGARICLLNKAQRVEAQRLARWVNYVGIALEPRFQEAFVEAIPLPHAVDAFPHLADDLAAAADRRQARGINDAVTARERRRQRS